MNLVEWFLLYLACLLPDALRDTHDADESNDEDDLTITLTVTVEDV